MSDAIVAAVGDGRLPEARLDKAVTRVLALRGEDRTTMLCRGEGMPTFAPHRSRVRAYLSFASRFRR